ncbi:MAG: ATP-binding protein [Clostridiales bacterium]|jgi:predicted AAA+ superfamily ATPase|nr:ATP-binding protein [Clostridiales bacterium]
MQRKIISAMISWKNSAYRKPLLLQGARQVGKTYTLLEFGKSHYGNVAYINLETSAVARTTFDEDIMPDKIIPKLSVLTGETIVKEKTLIIFDEVQACEKALTSLKYFCEFAPEYHIIASGSLLGIAVNRKQFSFPVGKVDRLTMYPMDFEEFLSAFGENALIEKIRICYNTNTPMDSVYHKVLTEYYRQYLVVGGMPEAAAKYADTKDFKLVRLTQDNILADYLDDMSKYNSANETKKTRCVYGNITVQLSKTNTKFQYKLLKSGGKASEFEDALQWLELTGIIDKCYLTEKIKLPLENYRATDAFKIYMSDIGLLCANKSLKPDDILYSAPSLNDFKGGLVENYVGQQLKISGYNKYCWVSGATAEVDFVIEKDNEIIPIEVKSADNMQAKSLNHYIGLYKPSYAIKIADKNFGFQDGKKTIPLYAAFCI